MPTGTQATFSRIDQFTSDGVQFSAHGVLATAAALQTTNIDLKVNDDVMLTGGIMLTKGSKFGDHASFQVVDVDGILAPAGTILGEYVTSWYMQESDQQQVALEVNYPTKILAGLYLRIVYVSTGLTAVQVAQNYFLHKVLF